MNSALICKLCCEYRIVKVERSCIIGRLSFVYVGEGEHHIA